MADQLTEEPRRKPAIKPPPAPNSFQNESDRE
jgi:hypothetical protein